MRLRGQKRRDPGSMTATEKRYSLVLESMRLSGEIERWDFEPERLVLGRDLIYQPDFRVITADMAVEFHEVKPNGWKFIPNQANSRTKIIVAAEVHPYVFKLAVERAKKAGGGFEVSNVEPR